MVFFKGRLTVLQINGSRPSLLSAASRKKKVGGSKCRFSTSAARSRWSEPFLHVDGTKSACWAARSAATERPGPREGHRKCVPTCSYNDVVVTPATITLCKSHPDGAGAEPQRSTACGGARGLCRAAGGWGSWARRQMLALAPLFVPLVPQTPAARSPEQTCGIGSLSPVPGLDYVDVPTASAGITQLFSQVRR